MQQGPLHASLTERPALSGWLQQLMLVRPTARAQTFMPLVEKCKALGRAMRIGTNHGSLSARILSYYGDTPRGMVESAFEFADICRSVDYHNFLFSMKASNPLVMVQARARVPSAPGSLTRQPVCLHAWKAKHCNTCFLSGCSGSCLALPDRTDEQ